MKTKLAFVAFLLVLCSHAHAADAGITYTYDALHRLTSVTYPHGGRVEFSYDAFGNRTSYVVNAPQAPTSETIDVADGDSPNIFITNAGGPGASYEWYRNGAQIGTTTDPSFAIAGFSPQHAGIYSVMVREVDGSISFVDLMVKLTGLTYESWLEFKEGPGALASDPGLGRMERPPPDGVENILKFAVGKGPRESARESLPQMVRLDEGPQWRMGLRFSRIFNPSDITIRVEASEDLIEWFDVTDVLTPASEPSIASDGLTEEVTFDVQDLVSPVSGGVWRFFRLNVQTL